MQKTRDRPKQKKKFSLKKSFEGLIQKLKLPKAKAAKKQKPKAKKLDFKESFNKFKAELKNAFKIKSPGAQKAPKPTKKQNGTKPGKIDPVQAVSGVLVIFVVISAVGLSSIHAGGTKVIIKYKDVIVDNNNNSNSSNLAYNIYFGDIAPSDTSKLWIKTAEPAALKITSNIVVGSEEMGASVGAIPTAASGIASAAVGTKVYLFGGQTGTSSFINTINVFDTETNTVTKLSATLPTAAGGIASAVVGTKVYLFGGQRGSSNYLYTINEFTTLLKLTSNNILVEANLNNNLFNLLPTLEIGVNNVYLGNADGYAEKVPAYLYKNGAWVEI